MFQAFRSSKITHLLMAVACGNLVATTSLGRTLRRVHEALVHAVHVRACAAFQLTDRVAHFPITETMQHSTIPFRIVTDIICFLSHGNQQGVPIPAGLKSTLEIVCCSFLPGEGTISWRSSIICLPSISCWLRS